MPNWYWRFPYLVHWSLEQFNYPLSSGRSKGWDQGNFPWVLISSGRTSDVAKACISICTYVPQLQVAISFELFIKPCRKAVPSNLVLSFLEHVLSSTPFPSEGTGRLGVGVCHLPVTSVSILSHPSVLQVHGQKAAWEDPVEWVRDTLPWPSAQQDQSKLYHLPPPSVGPHSIVSPPEERSGKDSTPNSLESDPLVCFQLANENSRYWELTWELRIIQSGSVTATRGKEGFHEEWAPA